MQQKATIVEILPDNEVKLVVSRESACSGDCHKCGGCGSVSQKFYLIAKNDINAQKGEIVYVESDKNVVLGAAVLVYLLPLLLFLACYLIANSFGRIPVLFGAIGFVLGFIPAALYNSSLKRKPQVHRVIGRVL